MRVVAASVVVAAVAAACGTTSGQARLPTFGVRASITPQISSNWSGYAAISADPAAPVTFSDVTGTWKVPKATCTAGRFSSAAFWVGLGGYDSNSTSLEQLGIAAECEGTTRVPKYDAWWELVPASSVRIPLVIHAGDTVTAAVLVQGQTITYSLKDVTRGTRVS